MTFSATNAGIPAGPHYSSNLHLKVWSGEVLTTFNRETVLKPRVRVRNIASGSSAQFPAIGRGAGAAYHTPGQVILGQDVNHGEVVIPINDLLVTDRFVSNWEEAVTHYDVRSEYTRQMGDDLAQAYDRHLFAVAVAHALAGTAGPVPGMGAAANVNIGATPTVDTIIGAIYNAATAFDQKNIPKNDRFYFVNPATYWALVKDGRLLNRDFGNSNGNQMNGGLMKVAGFEIVVTNNLSLNFSLDANMVKVKRNGVVDTFYNVDASAVVGLAMHRSALGAVHLMDVSTESEYQIERQGTLAVSKMSVGYGALRTEAILTHRAA